MVGWDVAYEGSVERAAGTKSFRFSKPAELDFLPGQFAFFAIPAADVWLRRHLTISSSPTEPFVEFTTRMTGSDYKNALETLPEGTECRLEGVQGRFTLDHGTGKVAYVAGGVGVTPARSAIKWAADTGADVDIVLLYANRDVRSACFLDEFEALSSDRFRLVNVLEDPPLEWTGPVGYISADVVRGHVPDWQGRVFYLAGPPGMVDAIEPVLTDEVGVAPERLKVEQFTGY